MRKLWLRLWLWWNNICPEHGEMYEGFGPGGKVFHYCILCSRIKNRRYARVRQEYQGTL